MHRFFVPDLRINDQLASLSDARLIHQVKRVLRMRSGDELVLFTNGEPIDYVMKIVEMENRVLKLHLSKQQPNRLEPKRIVHLYQAIPKKTALFELILQKSTEIGVTHIHPLITARTEHPHLTKLERREAIVMEASEQCGRARLPLLHSPIHFKDAILKAVHPYLGYEFEERRSLPDYWPTLERQSEVSLFIGPEGGFTQEEIEEAEHENVRLFSLGKRILRVETASIAALSLLLLSHLDHE